MESATGWATSSPMPRCEAKNISLPRPYRKKGYMSDLDKMLGELMEYDLSLTLKHIQK